MIWVVIFCVLAYAFFVKFLKPAFYWKIRGVFHVSLYPRFLKVFLTDKSFLEIVKKAYEEFPDRRYYGSFQFLRPSLFVTDVDLLKKITVKDFDYFQDHSSVSNDQVDPVVNQNLFLLKGDKWRDMRSTLSPAFTSNKMKLMFVLIADTAKNFTNYLLKNNESQLELEIKDFYSKYTNDVIASCAFGIDCDSLKNKDNEFFKMGQFFSSSAFAGRRILRGLVNAFFPSLAKIFKIQIFPSNVTGFFKTIVEDTISYREKEGIVRPDMIHLLLEARKGRLKHEGNDVETAGFATVEESNTYGKSGTNKMRITDDIITAQAFVFFFAGFDTSSAVLSFLSYELALKPNIQKKLQLEIDETLENSGGKLEYDALLKMKYLDQVVSETLRMYPPGIALNRVCTKDYFIPAKLPNEKNLTLEKGCIVIVPVYGIHMDPKFFPNPGKFDPERFNDENKANIVPGTYMPFGSGPRNCIGSRFALLETKALLVSLLSKFEIVSTEKTEVPLQFSKTPVLGSKNGIWLALKKR